MDATEMVHRAKRLVLRAEVRTEVAVKDPPGEDSASKLRVAAVAERQPARLASALIVVLDLLVDLVVAPDEGVVGEVVGEHIGLPARGRPRGGPGGTTST